MGINSDEQWLSVRDLTFSYDNRSFICNNVTFSVPRASFVALVGPSGIGKSSLLKICAGLLVESDGQVRLAGDVLSPQQRLGRVAYMPQTDTLLPWRTSLENVSISLEIKGVAKKQALARAYDWLKKFQLADFAHRLPRELSGGMRQRISFLRTLLSDADVLLLDEPFSSLDGLTRMHVQHWLLQTWQADQRTILMITHDLEEALLLADKVFVWQESAVSFFRELPVNFPRPRAHDLRYSPNFAELKKQLSEMLEVVR